MKGARLFAAGVLVAATALAGAPPAASAASTCEEILVPMADGMRLHGWARHGADAAAEHPVVWTMTPYANTGCRGNVPYDAMTPEMVERVTIVSISYRGTGASEGEQDAWGPGDRADVQAVGDWLAARPYASGLFPIGASAEAAWITFALDHPAVIGSLWVTSCADGYRQCVRSGGELAGGAFALAAGQVGGYLAGLPDRLRNQTLDPLPPIQLAATLVNGLPAFLEDTNGEFWDSRLGLEFLDGLSVPVMFTTDLYDFVPGGMYLAYERMRDHAPAGAPGAWLSTIVGHNAPPAVSSDATTLGAPPLAEDTEVSGPVVLHVRAAATAPDFDWQVRLADVHPDGRSTWITDGQLRASLGRVDEAASVKNDDGDYVRPRLPSTEHEPVPLLVPADYVIELAPTSNVFRAGHRIRLDIQPLLTGYVDSVRSLGIGMLRVLRGAESRLVLPVIPGRCQLGTPGAADVAMPSCGAGIGF